MLVRSGGFSLAAILCLALGIGATSAMFTLVDAVLLRPLPFRDPGSIVILWNHLEQTAMDRLETSGPEYFDYLQRSTPFEELAAFYSPFYVNLTGDGTPERLRTAITTASFFSLLGVEPALGRAYGPEEDLPDNVDFAVLSYGFWQRRFGSDPQVIGRKVLLNGDSTEILGVMPPEFRYPDPQIDVWLPIGLDPADPGRRGRRWLTVLGRLPPGMTLAQARSQLEVVRRQIIADHPENYGDTGWNVSLHSLQEDLVGPIRPALVAFLAAVGLLLVIACCNVASLLLARASLRDEEMAVRTALGAGRLRLVRQLLAESVLLGLAGGAVGLLLAWLAVRWVVAHDLIGIPRLGEVRLDATAFAVTAAVSILCGVLFGLAPALETLRSDLQAGLREGGRTDGGGKRVRPLNLLVIAEVALALVLVIGAALMVDSLLEVRSVDPGFRPDGVLVMDVAVPYFRPPQDVIAFYQQLVERLRGLPGVDQAGAVSHLPLSGLQQETLFTLEGSIRAEGEELPTADMRSATPGYHRTLGIPLLAGRWFTAADDADAPKVAIVDEKLARQYWGGSSPVGKRIQLGISGDGPWITIVGVVGHVKHSGLEVPSRGQLYVPHPQTPWRDLQVVLHTRGSPQALAQAVRRAVWDIDKDQPVANVRTMGQVVADSVAQRRFATDLFVAFAAMALLLAIVGVYAVMAYSVSERRREIGIRMALGSQRRQVLLLVVGRGLRLAAVGVVLGLVASLAGTRVLASLLFETSAVEPAIFVGVALILVGVAFLASYLPALRASGLAPTTVLRDG